MINKIVINKKSQVSIFIILGIVIVFALAGLLTFRSDFGNFGIIIGGNVNPDIKPIYNFVTECVRTVGEDGIYQIGKTGGYVEPPEPRVSFKNIDDEGIAFYLYDKGYRQENVENDNLESSEIASAPPLPGAPSPLGDSENIEKENYMPSKEKIQDELSRYMDGFIYFCTNDFNDFPTFNITQADAKTSTKIENGKVIFDVNYPLQISKGNKVYSVKKFEASVPVRLNEIYSLVSEVMERQMQKQDSVCLSCIHDIATKYDMKVKMMDSEEGIVFGVLDEKSTIKNADYVFYFANKYD